MRFDLEYGEVVILDAAQAAAATADILAQHSIPAAASPDLLRGEAPGGGARGGGKISSSSSSSSSSTITLAPEMAPSVGATSSASAGAGDGAAGAGASTA